MERSATTVNNLHELPDNREDQRLMAVTVNIILCQWNLVLACMFSLKRKFIFVYTKVNSIFSYHSKSIDQYVKTH